MQSLWGRKSTERGVKDNCNFLLRKTYWKRPCRWEGLIAGGDGSDRWWDGWMASPTPGTWVSANSGRWWRIGKPGVFQSMGSQSQTPLNKNNKREEPIPTQIYLMPNECKISFPEEFLLLGCAKDHFIFIRNYLIRIEVSSVQFSRSVVSDSLRPHESQHARPPCPSSPTPGVHSDSRPSSQWCHPAISSSVVPFSSCPQSLPASESFPVSQL